MVSTSTRPGAAAAPVRNVKRRPWRSGTGSASLNVTASVAAIERANAAGGPRISASAGPCRRATAGSSRASASVIFSSKAASRSCTDSEPVSPSAVEPQIEVAERSGMGDRDRRLTEQGQDEQGADAAGHDGP